MHDIICPHCHTAFKIDEAGYADILKQVRDKDFSAQLHERLELAAQDTRKALELAQLKAAGELQRAAAAKDAEIQKLKATLEASEVARNLAVAQALGAVEKERDALAAELRQAKQEQQLAASLAQAQFANELRQVGQAFADRSVGVVVHFSHRTTARPEQHCPPPD